MSNPLWIFIGNSDNRRCKLFNKALPHEASFLSISYERLLRNNDIINFLEGELSQFSDYSHWLIKFDSIGENFVTEKLLLQSFNKEKYQNLVFDKGRLANQKDWFMAFSSLLHSIESSLYQISIQKNTICFFLNTVSSILLMTDKLSCQKFLDASFDLNRTDNFKINTPPRLPSFDDFDALIDYMCEKKIPKIFIKPRYGSSATGILALHVNLLNKKMIARTTIAYKKKGQEFLLYNTLKVPSYTDRDIIKKIYQTLIVDDLYCEKWLPKAKLQGKNFDLRIVVTDKKPQHVVVRTSLGPITNLHLGNQRGDLTHHESMDEILFNANYQAELVAKKMEGAGLIGVDIIADKKKAYVLELNSFGDLLPNATYKGLSTYQTQINAMLARVKRGR